MHNYPQKSIIKRIIKEIELKEKKREKKILFVIFYMNVKGKCSKVLRVKECSLYLSMSKATFLRLVQRGELPKGTKLSPRCTVWKVEDLDKFIESKNVNEEI